MKPAPISADYEELCDAADRLQQQENTVSKQVTIEGYVYEVDYRYRDEKEYRFFMVDGLSDNHHTLIGPASFSYTVPDTFNPTAAKLAALEAEKAKVRAAFAAKVKELDDRIANLQALEYVEAA